MLYIHIVDGYNDNAEAGKSLPAVIAEWQNSSQTLRESVVDLFAMLEEAGIDHI